MLPFVDSLLVRRVSALKEADPQTIDGRSIAESTLFSSLGGTFQSLCYTNVMLWDGNLVELKEL